MKNDYLAIVLAASFITSCGTKQNGAQNSSEIDNGVVQETPEYIEEPEYIPEGWESWTRNNLFYVETVDQKTIAMEITSPSTCAVSSETERDIFGTVTIPAHVFFKGELLTVTSISGSAFSQCRNLGTLILPETVVAIGDLAFSFCLSLRRIVIPGEIVYLGHNAFNSCIELENLELKGSFPNNPPIFDFNYTFANCRKLSSIILPQNYELQDSSIFKGCVSLREIKFGNKTFHDVEPLISWEE